MSAAEPCRDPDDKLRLRLDEIADRMRELALDRGRAGPARGHRAAGQPQVAELQGRGHGQEGLVGLRPGRASGRDAAKPGTAWPRCVPKSPTPAPVGSEAPSVPSPWTARGPASEPGQLEFHDLLVLARALLRDPEHGPAVRATLHERYDRLLLDEFQDTDPIQIELAVRIAAADPATHGGGERPAGSEVDVAPGSPLRRG